jgi:transcriptional regulator GlxA family with amidase domain
VEELSKRRLVIAKRILSDTDLSLSEVARQSGFASATRLCEVFRRDLSTTPATYRQL